MKGMTHSGTTAGGPESGPAQLTSSGVQASLNSPCVHLTQNAELYGIQNATNS